MDDAGEWSRATRRQVLGATAGALAVGALPGRTGAQQASGPTVYVGSSPHDDGTLYAVDAATGEQEWAFTPLVSVGVSNPSARWVSSSTRMDLLIPVRTLGRIGVSSGGTAESPGGQTVGACRAR